MIRIDLETAGIAYVVESPDGPEYADFHSLRHSYLTLGGRSGIDLRTLQELAGHSDPKLTARYSHRRLIDLSGVVCKLPNLVPATDQDHDGIPQCASDAEGQKGVVPGVVTGRAEQHPSAPKCTLGIFGASSDDAREPLERKGGFTEKHRSASIGTSGASRIRTENQGIMSPLL